MVNHCARKICVFTGSRADYGHLVPLLRLLQSDSEIDLQLLVSGGHLVPDQGLTVQEIEADSFHISEKVDMVLARDTPTAIAKSFGLACIGYADALARIQPDVLVVLGDRYEAFAATLVAVQQGTIVAHIGGGQVSQGSLDNQMRHAISKLAHLHFTINPRDSERLIGMGEEDRRIVQVGMIGIDSAVFDGLLDRAALGAELGIELNSPILVVTYHPATADPRGSRKGLVGMLDALDAFPDATLIITAPNVDSGGREIARDLYRYSNTRDHVHVLLSLGQRAYLSLLRHSDVVVGNSSSGIHEAPLLGTPSVNIGSRQDGRSKPPSVVDCDESSTRIRLAISECLSENSSMVRNVPLDWIDKNLRTMADILKLADIDNLRRK